MNNMKYILFIILTTLFISGCSVKNNNTMTIDKNGDFSYNIIVAVDEELLTNAINMDNNENKSESDFIEEKLSFTFLSDLYKIEYSNDEYYGYEYNYNNKIDSLVDNNINEVILNDYNSNEKLINKKLFKKDKNGIYSAKFIFDLTKEESNDLSYIGDFTLNLPSKAISHNADDTSNDGKTLSWKFKDNEVNVIEFSFMLNNNRVYSLMSILIGEFICILIIIILLIFKKKWFFKNRKKLIVIFSIIFMLSFYTVFTLNKNNKVFSIFVNNYSKYSGSNLRLINDTIYLDYNAFEKSFKLLNKNEDLNNSDTIINKTMDYLINNAQRIDYVENENNSKLQISMKKDVANKAFKNFFNVNNDIILIVTLDNSENKNEVNILKEYMNNNKERIIRRNIVNTASNEVGNTGEKYWNWYGFNHRVEWCCVFVSWVANQNNVLNTKIPKFIWVKKGVDFFKENNQFKYPKNYTPKEGDVIFFDWNNNPIVDHVGIVEKVSKGYVYTIEGNSGKIDVKRKKYKLNSSFIYGYGIPSYGE